MIVFLVFAPALLIFGIYTTMNPFKGYKEWAVGLVLIIFPVLGATYYEVNSLPRFEPIAAQDFEVGVPVAVQVDRVKHQLVDRLRKAKAEADSLANRLEITWDRIIKMEAHIKTLEAIAKPAT